MKSVTAGLSSITTSTAQVSDITSFGKHFFDSRLQISQNKWIQEANHSSPIHINPTESQPGAEAELHGISDKQTSLTFSFADFIKMGNLIAGPIQSLPWGVAMTGASDGHREELTECTKAQGITTLSPAPPSCLSVSLAQP